MTGIGAAARRWLLLAIAAVLPVAVGVTGNQILNSGQWTWWWIPIAIACSAGLVGVTHLLTRPTPSTGPAATSAAGQPQPDPGQSVTRSTIGGGVTQIKGVTASLRLGPSRSGSTGSAVPSTAAPDPAGDTIPAGADAVPPPGPAPAPPTAASRHWARQSVRESQVRGEVLQVDGVGGDAEIDR